MNCYFINLASAKDRRTTLEENLHTQAPHWQIHRIEAVTAAEAINQSDYNSADNPSATGCYLSHIRAIEASLIHPDHVVILEDDSKFGQRSAQTIENVVGSLPQDSWDIIFGSVTYLNIQHANEAFFRTRQARVSNSILFSEAGQVDFACATTYVVNKSSKVKLLDLLKSKPRNNGYDMQLREFLHSGQLRGLIPHPFLTTVSHHSSTSQLNQNGLHDQQTDCVLNAFRKLLFAERNLEEIRQDLISTKGYFDDAESEVFSRIYAAFLSPKFKGK